MAREVEEAGARAYMEAVALDEEQDPFGIGECDDFSQHKHAKQLTIAKRKPILEASLAGASASGTCDTEIARNAAGAPAKRLKGAFRRQLSSQFSHASDPIDLDD
jgi:hypothetical protein